jgi:hypothetical protein
MKSIYIGLVCIGLTPLAGAQGATSSSCAAAAIPNQRKDAETIRSIEQAWLTAEYRGDRRFLECLLEPDYQTSGRDGTIRSRQSVIDRVPATPDSTRQVPKLETIAVVRGNVATAHSILRTTDKSGNPKEVHFVDGYTFHDGRWHAFSGADL